MKLDFNDYWRCGGKSVTLPHDAMLEERRDLLCRSGKQSGFFPGGRYLYEKTFVMNRKYKKAELLFEGVYSRCVVKVNGKQAAYHAYGFTEFRVDVTKLLKKGSNTVSVDADNSLVPNCRWYSGSGIIRPVWLLLDEPKEPKIVTKSIGPAVVEIEAEGKLEIYDGQTLIAAGKSGEYEIPEAKLWSDEAPYLYTCKVGTLEVPFGIRLLQWDAAEGLRVNGKRTLLRGGCVHHDNGVLGARGFRDAEERRVRILKEAGYNAIRSAHNPMSRAMLDACDKYGMYVMDECFDGWYLPKNYHDYARLFDNHWREDLTAMVEKDKNHPSVILYSIGNEVTETVQEKGVALCGEMADFVRQLDGTRPVTLGLNIAMNVMASRGMGLYKDKGKYKAVPLPPLKKPGKEPRAGSAYFNHMQQLLGSRMKKAALGKRGDKVSRDVARQLDVVGYNYGSLRIDGDVKAYPDRIIVASETMASDLPYNWQRVQKYPAVIGDFVWTAWDYLGEADLGAWNYASEKGMPLLAGSGTIDITGKITAECFYQQVVWGLRKEPYIGVAPLNHSGEAVSKHGWRFTDVLDSWNWPGYEGKKTRVEVYAPGAAVRLEQNGKVLGTKKLREFRAEFLASYAPGTLTAVALDDRGREISRFSLSGGSGETVLTAVPEKRLLSPGELCFLPVEFTDASGVLQPGVERKVTVQVSGAELIGLGSARCRTDESFLSDTVTAYRGRALAVIRVTVPGKPVITVSAPGVEPVTVNLEVY